MRQICLVSAVLVLGFVVGGWSQEPTPATDAQSKTTPAGAATTKAPARRLPTYYGQVGLQASQRESIYALQDKYGTQIDALIRQVETLRQQRDKEIEAVLNAEQRAELKRLTAAAAAARQQKAAKKSSAEASPEASAPSQP